MSITITQAGLIRQKREAMRLTENQAADLAGINPEQYRRFESGERKLACASFYVSLRVLNALGIEVGEFIAACPQHFELRRTEVARHVKKSKH